jgi:hypothetical protein
MNRYPGVRDGRGLAIALFVTLGSLLLLFALMR